MMLVRVYKSQLQTLALIKPLLSASYYSTKAITPTNVDFKISFLKNNCGLSGKPLINASKCLNFDSSDQRPHLVLELFRSFGFPLSSITKIISTNPRILHMYRPDNNIKPKLDYLLSISQSQQDVVAVVTKSPKLLTRSLTNYLIPSIDLINSVTGSYPNTLSVLKYNPYLLSQNIPQSFLLNTRFLLTLGVPHSQILRLLTNCGPVLGISHDKFCDVVLKIKTMDFDFESSYFCGAINVLCYVTDSAWESRCVLFRNFGFSHHDIVSIFKRLPAIMGFTDKLFNEKMDFFLNKLQWTTHRLSSNPAVVGYSLEKRTIPRCSVLQVLAMKNSTSESYMLSTILAMTESKFIINFVTAHKDEIPEVIEAYQGKLRFDEYTFKHKGQTRLKPV